MIIKVKLLNVSFRNDVRDKSISYIITVVTEET